MREVKTIGLEFVKKPVIALLSLDKTYKIILSVLSLTVIASPAFADMPFFFVVAFAKWQWWAIPLTIVIEALALRWFFSFSWKQAAWASTYVNLATGIAGFIIYPLAGRFTYPLVAPLILMITKGGYIIEAGVTMAGMALIDTALELALLKWKFKTSLSGVRIFAFLMANVITASILFASMLPSETWHKIPESEVGNIEEHFAPEIKFMQRLLKEVPDQYGRDGKPFHEFNKDWMEARQTQAGNYRFIELWIYGPERATNFIGPPTFKERRFESGYSREAIEIEKGFMWYSNDYSIPICLYQITRTKNDQVFKVRAFFDLTSINERR